jgi:uncharacterized damage-inducible protein DinB
MTKSNLLANRLKEVLLDGKWIANTNIQEQLKKTDWKQASKKIGDHNSIAELTFHINYYLGGILNVFNGGNLEIRDKYSFDMHAVTSEEDWQELTDSFLSNSKNIIIKISELPESQLTEAFVKTEYGTYERNIEGLIEHSYYHFGQISLLLKLIG